MNFIDFIIDIDKPFKDFTNEENKAFSETVLQRICLNRLKNNKPTVILLVADSGEGKSYTALSWVDTILKSQGVDFAKHLDDVIIFTPLEYVKKVDRLLHDKALKKVNVIMIDEARALVKASTWHSFVNQAIADVNAMSRGVKPMVFFIITQFIKDIDPATRRTLTFYGKCARPRRSVKLWLYKLWKDDRDIERPELKRRRIYGVVRRKNRKMTIRPTFNFSLPRKELVEPYEKMQKEAKGRLIRRKMEMMLKKLEKDFKGMFDKVDAMVAWYVKRPDMLQTITETRRGKVCLNKDANAMYDLTKEEIAEFEKRLMKKLTERGLANGVQEKTII